MIGVSFYLQDIAGLTFPAYPEGCLDRIVYNARMMGASHVFMIDTTNYKYGQFYKHGDAEIAFARYESVSDLRRVVATGATLVYLENPATIATLGRAGTELKDYTHPDSAIYLVGADFGGFGTEAPVGGDLVYLPVSDMWAEGVLNIVLYDRLMKQA